MTASKNIKREAAREFARRGVPVLGLRPMTKVPYTMNGVKDATTDDAAICALWDAEPELNIGICPEGAGWGVVDIDGQVGEENWADLQLLHGEVGPTLTVRTPGGGRHLFGVASLPPTVGKLAPKIDTRGRNSYVVAPPSVLPHGAYTYEDPNVPVAVFPAWIGERVTRKREAQPAVQNASLDTPENVARGVAYVAGLDEIVERDGADAKVFGAACFLQNLGVLEATARQILVEHLKLRPSDSRRENFIAKKVESAFKYAQNAAGAYAVPDIKETFKGFESVKPPQAKPSRFRLIHSSAFSSLPEPSYIIKPIVPDNAIVLVYGPTRSFKTFLVQDWLGSVAAGCMAHNRFSVVQGSTILAAGEAPNGVAKLRWPAWRRARKIDASAEVSFYINPGVPHFGDSADLEQFIGAVKAAKVRPKLVAIDTVARALAGQDENDARAAGAVIAASERIRDELNCTVILIHHSGKDEDRGARGSSALAAGVDAIWRVSRPAEGQAIRLSCEKMKDADEPPDIHLIAEPVDGSLALNWISADEFAAGTRSNPPLAPADVGQALKQIGAVKGVEITTHALAVTLAGVGADHKAISAMEQRLRRGAKGVLAAYTTGGGGQGAKLGWTFPALETEGAGDAY